jgi:hypothetical protein
VDLLFSPYPTPTNKATTLPFVIPRVCDFFDFSQCFGGRKAVKSIGQEASSGSFDYAL